MDYAYIKAGSQYTQSLVTTLLQKLDSSLFLRKIVRQPPTEQRIRVYCERALRQQE